MARDQAYGCQMLAVWQFGWLGYLDDRMWMDTRHCTSHVHLQSCTLHTCAVHDPA